MRLILIWFLSLQSGNIPKAGSTYLRLIKHAVASPSSPSKALNPGTLWNAAPSDGLAGIVCSGGWRVCSVAGLPTGVGTTRESLAVIANIPK
jgi:hypothetical protein